MIFVCRGKNRTWIVMFTVRDKHHRIRNRIRKMFKFLMTLFLKKKTVGLGNSRWLLHHKDIGMNLLKIVIKFHEEIHHTLFLLQGKELFSKATNTIVALIIRKWTEVIKFIPNSFQFGEVIRYEELG